MKDEAIKESKPEIVAEISLNRLISTVLMVKIKLMNDNLDKVEIYRLLDNIEFELLLMNDEDNSIRRDLK